MKRSFFLSLALILALTLAAQAPSGYYNKANGKTGYALKTALCTIISTNTKSVGYSGLWTVYKTSDVREDGCIWDMYSNATNYSAETMPAGNSSEGSGMNREHSFPKSWWGGSSNGAQYSDAFHVVPVDGYLNNRRSNYPYGETSNPTFSSKNEFSKLGPCRSDIGYNGTVFEPNDEYKGDFARIYFYMATRYQNEIASWSSPMLAGNSDSVYTKWALTMLMRWAANDPVSEKEINRNNAVYAAQNNRNPFVDFPGLEQYVWGNKRGTPFDISGNNPSEDPVAPAAPIFSINGGTVQANTTVTITSLDGLPICYTTNGDTWQQAATPLTINISETVTISAYCERESLRSATISYTFTVPDTLTQPDTLSQSDGTVYELITTASDLLVGERYLIVCESKETSLGQSSGKVRSYVSVSIDNHTVDLAGVNETPTTLTLGQAGNAYTFYIPAERAYLALTSDANNLGTVTSITDEARWTVTFNNDNAFITNSKYTDRAIYYNSTSPRFATYKSTSRQTYVQLYRAVTITDPATGLHIQGITTPTTSSVYYDLQGRRLTHPMKGGIYIINGRKIVR